MGKRAEINGKTREPDVSVNHVPGSYLSSFRCGKRM